MLNVKSPSTAGSGRRAVICVGGDILPGGGQVRDALAGTGWGHVDFDSVCLHDLADGLDPYVPVLSAWSGGAVPAELFYASGVKFDGADATVPAVAWMRLSGLVGLVGDRALANSEVNRLVVRREPLAVPAGGRSPLVVTGAVSSEVGALAAAGALTVWIADRDLSGMPVASGHAEPPCFDLVVDAAGDLRHTIADLIGRFTGPVGVVAEAS